MKHNLIATSPHEKALGWPYLVIQLLFLPTLVALISELVHLGLTIAELNIVLFVINFITVAFIFHRFLLKNFDRAIQNTKRWLLLSLAGFGIYMLSLYTVNIFIAFLHPQHINANNETISDFAASHYTLMFIGTVLLVPITEETLYRGLIFGSLYRVHPILGYVFSALIFSLIHVVGYIGIQDWFSLFLSLLQYVPAGLVLGWAYAKSGTIWTPILIHAVINMIGILSMR